MFGQVTLTKAALSLDNSSGNLLTTVKQTGVDTSSNLETKVGVYINIALGLVGIIFFILMVYAGFRWLVSRGNEEDIKKSQNTIIAAIIGLIIVLCAYGLSNLLINGFPQVANDAGNPNDPQGCCFDLVQPCNKDNSLVWTGGSGLGYKALWTDRGLTTEANCKTTGNNEKDPNDCAFGPDKWQWHSELTSMEQCDKYFKNNASFNAANLDPKGNIN